MFAFQISKVESYRVNVDCRFSAVEDQQPNDSCRLQLS